MAISESKKRADARYHKKVYEQIKISSRKEDRLSDLIDFAVIKTETASKAQYIMDAVKARLEQDGVSIDQLPPVGEEE